MHIHAFLYWNVYIMNVLCYISKRDNSMAASEMITLSETGGSFRLLLFMFFPLSSCEPSPSLQRLKVDEEDDVTRSKREFCTSIFRHTSSSTDLFNGLMIVDEDSIQSPMPFEVFRSL